MIRVLIISHIRLYREAIAEVIDRRENFSVVGAKAAPWDWESELRDTDPDVVLFDVLMPGALDRVRTILAHSIKLEIIALGMSDSDADILACAEAGVSGFVSRSGSIEDVIVAMTAAVNDELICSPRIVKSLARRLAKLSAGQKRSVDTSCLTTRELEIAALIDQGCSNKVIARSLGIAVSTVKNHVHHILEKLQVHRRGEAVALLRHCFD